MTLAPTLRSQPQGHYRATQVARAEVSKIVSLRSTVITLGLTVVAALVVTVLVTHSQLGHAPHYYDGFDPTSNALSGMIVVALTGGVFGALMITNEYSSGTMRSTLAATPNRPLLLATKITVIALLTLVLCEVLSFACFFLGQGILSGGGAPSATLATPGAAGAVVMTGAFIALMTLMAFGFGFALRSTAAAIAAFVGVVFVLPLVVQGISEHAVHYLPSNILVKSIMTTVQQAPPGAPNAPLPSSVGMLLMVLYAAIALVAGAVVFLKRDA
jgi:ABC-type transport system involved in multi-copper enzyme maturation permease subunit